MKKVVEMTLGLSKDLKQMKKSMEDLQITLNEKEAEVIRLNMCLGDEKKRV
jgi:hypothetical protein